MLTVFMLGCYVLGLIYGTFSFNQSPAPTRALFEPRHYTRGGTNAAPTTTTPTAMTVATTVIAASTVWAAYYTGYDHCHPLL